MKNRFFAFLFLAVLSLACSCTSSSKDKSKDVPSWYVSPKQNNPENLFGVAEGFSLEEATKYALADAAARLMVSVSSESSLIREENNTSTNEEMRQQVRQNVEKISFTDFKVTKSEKLGAVFYVEVQIKRDPFISQQKERLIFLERQVSDLEKDLKQNPIQRRNALLRIMEINKEIELKSRILAGAGEDINLRSKLERVAYFQNQLDKISDKIEFYFEINSPKEIAQIIRSSLNREKLKIASVRQPGPNQVMIKIKSTSRTGKIYEAYMTKLEVDFENISDSKVLASNSIEITGSSMISEKEAYAAALKNLEEKIKEEGILKIVGITN